MKRVDIFFEKYYTDTHNVDEDEGTISAHNSDWIHGSDVGVMGRNLLNSPTNFDVSVASSNTKKSQIIRIFIMSTKI